MKCLLIFLSILKFIGIAVLVLLALIIVLLLVLLFAGIRYEASSDCDEDGSNNRTEGFVSYAFGLAKLRFCYANKSFDYRLSVCLFKILDSKKKSGNKGKIETKHKEQTAEKTKPNTENLTKDTSDDAEKKINRKTKRKKPQKSKKTKSKKFDFGKIVEIFKQYDIGQLARIIFKFLKSFIKALGIKQFEADTLFGFDDPSTTGLVLGGAAALTAFLPFRIGLKGNFEGKAFELRGNINGRTSLIRLIIPIVVFIKEKPVWEIITNKRG
jgi:hypothetical protein